LISSIKRIFPRTNIVVVGHSNGGLIAEQWWLNHRDVARGIQQVFSLDSPLNGLFDAGFCSIDLCAPFGVSAQLGDYYSALWSSQFKNDPYWAALDAKDKAFTAVGSYGDPFVRRRRQRGDHAADDRRPDRNRFPVVLHRAVMRGRFRGSVRPLHSSVPPTGRYFVDPCAPASNPLDIEWGPPLIPPGFGAAGSLWMHSVVKNCPGVVSYILSFATPAARAITSKTSLTGRFGPPTTANGGHVVDVTVRDKQHPNGDPTAAGTVTVRYGGPDGQVVGASTVHAGRAVFTLSPGDPGADSLAAYYSGDAAHKPSAVCLVHGLEQCP
jgi:hypothetical protein